MSIAAFGNKKAEVCGECSMFDVTLPLESCMICGVLRCNATWKRDLGPRCGPCEYVPYSLWFDFLVVRQLGSHDLALNKKNSIFHFNIRPITCTWSLPTCFVRAGW